MRGHLGTGVWSPSRHQNLDVVLIKEGEKGKLQHTHMVQNTTCRVFHYSMYSEKHTAQTACMYVCTVYLHYTVSTHYNCTLNVYVRTYVCICTVHGKYIQHKHVLSTYIPMYSVYERPLISISMMMMIVMMMMTMMMMMMMMMMVNDDDDDDDDDDGDDDDNDNLPHTHIRIYTYMYTCM